MPIISIVTATEVTEPYWGPFQQKGCNRSTLREIQQHTIVPKIKEWKEVMHYLVVALISMSCVTGKVDVEPLSVL